MSLSLSIYIYIYIYIYVLVIDWLIFKIKARKTNKSRTQISSATTTR